jgi:2-(1,2-epoxy-1,2-dihydrophenyl)acetyl-CoA isomerase
MSMDYSVEGSIATVAFNRPERKNAMNDEMRRGIGDLFEQISMDDSVRAVILTGRGGAFCAGADVSGMGGKDVGTGRRKLAWGAHRAIRSVFRLDKPVIAAVEGPAAGIGWSYALACDFVVAAENAKFVFAQHKVGLAADGAAIWFLTRRVGMGQAKRLVYSARVLSGIEAFQMGLVDELVKPGSVMDAAKSLATEMGSGPTFAVAMSKALFAASDNSSFEDFLSQEQMAQPQVQQTADHAEAVAAFLEKRKANFIGR